MEEKSDKIRTSAESFQVSATRLEKIARHRRYRAYLIIFAMLLSFCLLMYLVFRSPAPSAPQGIGPEAALAETPFIGDSSTETAAATASKASSAKKSATATGGATSTTSKSSTTTVHHTGKSTKKPWMDLTLEKFDSLHMKKYSSLVAHLPKIVLNGIKIVSQWFVYLLMKITNSS